MKTKQMRKLSLNKSTIANLKNETLVLAKGGRPAESYIIVCPILETDPAGDCNPTLCVYKTECTCQPTDPISGVPGNINC